MTTKQLDLSLLEATVNNACYEPKRFPSCTIRARHPRATARVFASGKFNILGVKSERDARVAAQHVRCVFLREVQIHKARLT